MKYQIIGLTLGLCLWTTGIRAQEVAPLTPVTEIGIRDRVVNICDGDKFKSIVAAIQCVANKNCQDPAGQTKIYEDSCTVPDKSDGAVQAEVTKSNFDARPLLPAENNGIRPLTPVATKLLPPCECLALLENRFKCGIELCKPEEPKQPEQPPTADIPNKEVTPDTPKDTGPKQFLFEGSGCSLGVAGGFSELGAWFGLFAAASALGLRRKK